MVLTVCTVICTESKRKNENPKNEEDGMLSHLQTQMQETTAELERRNDRLKEMALHLSNEAELRISAERKACWLEQELQSVKDVLAVCNNGDIDVDFSMFSVK